MSPWLGFLDSRGLQKFPPESLCEEASKVDFREPMCQSLLWLNFLIRPNLKRIDLF